MKILITKKNCPKCEQLKRGVKTWDKEVSADNEEGFSLAIKHNVLSVPKIVEEEDDGSI